MNLEGLGVLVAARGCGTSEYSKVESERHNEYRLKGTRRSRDKYVNVMSRTAQHLRRHRSRMAASAEKTNNTTHGLIKPLYARTLSSKSDSNHLLRQEHIIRLSLSGAYHSLSGNLVEKSFVKQRPSRSTIYIQARDKDKAPSVRE